MTRRRTEMMCVRLFPEERDHLKQRAADCGRPLSTYVREVALGATPRARPHRIEREAVHHLARVGNNLNQLARAANAKGRVELSQRLDEVLGEVIGAIVDLKP